jgi:hypothetical protein
MYGKAEALVVGEGPFKLVTAGAAIPCSNPSGAGNGFPVKMDMDRSPAGGVQVCPRAKSRAGNGILATGNETSAEQNPITVTHGHR